MEAAMIVGGGGEAELRGRTGEYWSGLGRGGRWARAAGKEAGREGGGEAACGMPYSRGTTHGGKWT